MIYTQFTTMNLEIQPELLMISGLYNPGQVFRWNMVKILM